MVDSTDPSTWVYDSRFDDIRTWYATVMKGLDPSNDGAIPEKPVGPVVTGSFAAWKRSIHSPNVGLVAHCQKYFVHDAAEARVDEHGQMLVTCTCGLVVNINMFSDSESLDPRGRWSKFFAENRPTVSVAKQREFYEHPGHRDPFEKTVLGAFLARVRQSDHVESIELEMRCVTCGWLELNSPFPGDKDAFEKYAHRFPIDMHNLRCPQPGTDVWDGDMYLWGHGPASAWKFKQEKLARAKAARKAAELAESSDETRDDDREVDSE